MRELKETFKGIFSDLAVEELSLIKAAMEEKSEMLESRDKKIQLLLQEMGELKELQLKTKLSLQDLRKQVLKKEENAFREGGEAVIEDIVHILYKLEKVWSSDNHGENHFESVVVESILRMLEDKYHLEIIDMNQETPIDPAIHRVIEVQKNGEIGSRVVGLTKGYRIDKRVIKPACLKVIEGEKDVTDGMSESITGEECRISSKKTKFKIIKGGMITGANPNGVA